MEQTPKITFILGGPGSGKGTQCDQIVKEFNYLHISTGDIIRDETKKGGPDGEMLLKFQKEGKLVPFEVMCNLLIKTIKNTPAKNYLIDGFPRALDQAIYLERNFTECQTIINFYVANDQVLIDRLTKRGLTSGRADDNAETIAKRIKTFKDQTVPVVEYYKRFGKVKSIEANGSIEDIFGNVKKALLPTLYFLIGPTSSGKSDICKLLSETTAMKYIDYKDLVSKNPKENEIKMADIVISLYRSSIENRVIIEGFPTSVKQAQYFFRNCSIPDMIISIKCKAEFCHERNKKLGKGHPSYLSDVELSAKIREYNDNYKALCPVLKKEAKNFVEIPNANNSQVPFKQLIQKIQPQILLIKSQIEAKPFKDSLIKHLTQNGYEYLDVSVLMKDECDRSTAIGKEMLSYIQSGKIVPPMIVIKMLRKIVFNGTPKYIIEGFPETIEQADMLTQYLCEYKEMFIVADKEPAILQKDSKEEIETYLFKNRRLIITPPFPLESFDNFFRDNYSYILVYGFSASGKTTVSKLLSNTFGYILIDFPSIIEFLKKKSGKEDETVENIPFKDIREELLKRIRERDNPKAKYIIDGLPFEKPEEANQIVDALGTPERIIYISIDNKEAQYKLVQKKNNDGADLGEEAKAKIDKDNANVGQIEKGLEAKFEGKSEIIYLEPIITPNQAMLQIKDSFSPKIILLQHPPNVDIRTLCYNMAIKYDIIFIDVQKLIKDAIAKGSEIGKKLLMTKKPRNVAKELGQHCPGLYDEAEIYQLIKSEIDSYNYKDAIVLIDGLPQHQYLVNQEDLYELRPSQELLSIEKSLGNVVMCIKFTDKDLENLEDMVAYKQFELPKVEKKEEAPKEGEEGIILSKHSQLIQARKKQKLSSSQSYTSGQRRRAQLRLESFIAIIRMGLFRSRCSCRNLVRAMKHNSRHR